MAVHPNDAVAERIRALVLPPFDPLNRRAGELRDAGHHVISLGQAVPFFGPPRPALDAVRNALDTPALHRYATDPGMPALRHVLADRLGETLGGTFTPDELIITAGANHAFTLALTTVAAPGDEIVLPAPYFTNHQMMVCALGMTPVEAPVADRVTYAVRWSDIEPHLTPRTRAVVLCNPSNPTGAPVDAADGHRVVQEAAARGVIVISDETYMHFVYEGTHWSAASPPQWRRNAVIIGTCSKSFGMMGWRVGFMLADADICQQAVKVQDAMIICAPAASQVLAESAIRDCWTYPQSFHPELRRRRELLLGGLAGSPRIAATEQRGGLFVFARIDRCTDSVALSHRLLEECHVVTIAGRVFGDIGEGCLRLSFGFASQVDISEATDRLCGFLARE